MTKKIIKQEYSKFLVDLKKLVEESMSKAVFSINRDHIVLYHHIVMQIHAVQETQVWGAKIIYQLSNDVAFEFPEMKGFLVYNLKYMRKFAAVYPNSQFVKQIVAQLPWRPIYNQGTLKNEEQAIKAKKNLLKFSNKKSPMC
jgi:hypothetical protein